MEEKLIKKIATDKEDIKRVLSYEIVTTGSVLYIYLKATLDYIENLETMLDIKFDKKEKE